MTFFYNTVLSERIHKNSEEQFAPVEIRVSTDLCPNRAFLLQLNPRHQAVQWRPGILTSFLHDRHHCDMCYSAARSLE